MDPYRRPAHCYGRRLVRAPAPRGRAYFFTLSPRSTRRDDRISLRHFWCTFGALFAAVRPPIIRLVRLRHPACHRHSAVD